MNISNNFLVDYRDAWSSLIIFLYYKISDLLMFIKVSGIAQEKFML